MALAVGSMLDHECSRIRYGIGSSQYVRTMRAVGPGMAVSVVVSLSGKIGCNSLGYLAGH